MTHLVVKSKGDAVRSAPIELVDAGAETHESIVLTCRVAEFLAREPIRAVAYLPIDEFPASDTETDVGVEKLVSMPAYDTSEFGDYVPGSELFTTVTYDRIPKGEAELRGSSEVITADDHRLGDVAGFVIGEGNVATHVLARRGQLWWTREVTIPVEAVESFATDRISLNLAKSDVSRLPAVRVHRVAFF